MITDFLGIWPSYESTTDRTQATTETAEETTKGQLISKCLFWCLQFFQKTNKTIQLEVPYRIFRSFFGRIGRIENTKKAFRN